MKYNIIIALLCISTSCREMKTSRTSDREIKTSNTTFKNEGNPFIKDKFTADPAPLIYNNKLYLYVGHDEYYEGQDIASGGKEINITEWFCYSTDNLQNWTDNGSIMKPTDFD